MSHPVIEEETIKEVADILRSGQLQGFTGTAEGFDGGYYVRRLEDEFRAYFNVKFAIALNSATAALHASLLACEIGIGDEVIVTPYSFSSSASCVLMVGAIPVFADIQDDTFNIDPDEIRKKVNPRTKAIIPVHLCGHPANMTEVMRIAYDYGLLVIEDAAQAIGATHRGGFVGTIGDCGVFSFNQSKHISSGEGGMVITNDDRLAERVKVIRNHGEVSRPNMKLLGYNYRMCEIEACLCSAQLKKLDEMTDYRIMLTGLMTDGLKGIEGLTPPITYSHCKHVFYTYAVKYNGDIIGMHRDEFQDRLIKKGIYFGKGYVKPLYLHPIYQQFGYGEGLCPVTERMWRDELMVFDWLRYPTTQEGVGDAIKVVKQVLANVI